MSLEQLWARETIASERLRVTILAVIFAVLLVELVVGSLLLGHLEHPPLGFSPLWLAPLVLACLLYELAIRRALARIPAGAPIPASERWLNAAIEASIPGFILYAVARLVDPHLALAAPPVLLYFLLLILSVLRLEPRLSLFTAVVGAAQYVALSAVLTAGVADPQMPAGIPPLAPHLARAVLLVATGVVSALVADRIQRRMRASLRLVEEHNRVLGVFGQHVSPAVAEVLVTSRVEQRGELRRVCVMFLDVRGFTRFAEKRTPTDVVAFLDTLFEPMVAVVGRHRGIINKFLGDGFMAVFGAPLGAPTPARDAVAAAREILAGIERQVAAGALPPTRVGIGLHVGDALTGTIGGAARKEYTIIGDVVNLAARIEQLNKLHDSQLLVSADVAAALDEPDLHAIGDVTVPGRDAPVRLVRLA